MEIVLGVLVVVMVVVLRKELLGLKAIMTTGQDDAVLAEPHQFIERFHELATGDEWLAEVVLRNGLARFPGNKRLFEIYMEHLLEKAKSHGVEYLEEAHNALITYGEHAPLGELDTVGAYKSALDETRAFLIAKYDDLAQEANGAIIQELRCYLAELEATEVEKPARDILEAAARTEGRLDFATLTESQHEAYSQLKADYEAIAIRLGESFNQQRYREYNREVVERINDGFAYFQAGTKQKRIQENQYLIDLIRPLSTINPQYLTPETSFYFNHVYSFIFSEMSDSQKYLVTKMMTEAEKDLLE